MNSNNFENLQRKTVPSNNRISSLKATKTDIARWWLEGCKDKCVEILIRIAKFLILISSPATESYLIDSIIPAEKVYCLGLFFSRLFSGLPKYFLRPFLSTLEEMIQMEKVFFYGFPFVMSRLFFSPDCIQKGEKWSGKFTSETRMI